MPHISLIAMVQPPSFGGLDSARNSEIYKLFESLAGSAKIAENDM